MRQSKLLAQQAIHRPRSVGHFRRTRWSPRIQRVKPLDVSSSAVDRGYIPGEFDDPYYSPNIAALRRGVSLAWDISLLTALSPIFAVWFMYRGALRLKRSLAERGM